MTPSNTAARPNQHSEDVSRASYRGPFAVMTLLFFMWGFMTVWNDILIPRFKDAFALTYFQAMLVQFAFFGAYAVGSLVYYVVSIVSGDPINRIGYKNGVILGLLISALGSLLFVPAAVVVSYPFFLVAYFIVGLGFAMLQIAANPYVTILGPERTASSRLNLSQAVNSFGTTIGPVVGGYLIFHVFNQPGVHGAAAAKIPYLCFAGVFVLLAVLFWFARLPGFANEDRLGGGIGALRYPHMALGMVAIFMYVGGEVSVGSAIVNYLGSARVGGFSPEDASKYLAYFWGGLMIGRFMGAISLSELGRIKHALVLAVPVVALLLVGGLGGVASMAHYGPFLGLLLGAFFAGGARPQRLLAIFGTLIIALLLVGVVADGSFAMWSVLAVGLFCSIMWSNIFSLAIEGLGSFKSQASSLLVMAIMGGAILPPLQGLLADRIGIQGSFVVPMLAFAYVTFYGVYGYRAGRTELRLVEGDPAPGLVTALRSSD